MPLALVPHDHLHLNYDREWPAISARGSHTQITLLGAGLAETQQTEAGAHSSYLRAQMLLLLDPTTAPKLS